VVNDQYELQMDFGKMRLRGSIRSLHISLFQDHLMTLTEAYYLHTTSDTTSNKLDFQLFVLPNAAKLGANEKLIKTSQLSSHVKSHTVLIAWMRMGLI
jgi:hypothetical protein